MLDSPEPIDFTPLIKALEKAQQAGTFSEQKAELELALVEAELNPKADTYCDLLWSIETIGAIDISKRNWQPAEDHLEIFFN